MNIKWCGKKNVSIFLSVSSCRGCRQYRSLSSLSSSQGTEAFKQYQWCPTAYSNTLWYKEYENEWFEICFDCDKYNVNDRKWYLTVIRGRLSVAVLIFCFAFTSSLLWQSFHVFYSQASELIVKYDEHNLSNSFKFGVIYQKYGQVTINIEIENYLRGSC